MIDNFDQLVARCERARQRRIIRLSLKIVGTILFVIAGISGYQMWLTSQTKQVPAEQTAAVAEQTSPTAPVVPVKSTQPKKADVPTVHKSAAKNTPVSTKPEQKPAPSSSPTTMKPDLTVPSVPETAVAVPAVKNNRLFEVNTQKADTPLEAYQNNPKYETALDVARDYYAKKNFADAATWAKKANQMNREAEDAWLLYAKSYYAQGKKTEAIGVLELYLNYKDSKAASELLRTWKLNSTN
ncbi:MAG: CDC27 family protein [Sulfuricurvum sp.]|uniref:tetratricopeptide repeat protein n=1 Tax=Sulfuricurvum sp. TaxID=2025608 RepID=UPI00260910E1|nr:CDC27 family protein [Sulfuricurvum sp.]MDD2949679.1 CDC27 family protein [Sulfuricurvum sp.]MDD5116964.1 CDC27 family protein [Sulfuricurvum sp.]